MNKNKVRLLVAGLLALFVGIGLGFAHHVTGHSLGYMLGLGYLKALGVVLICTSVSCAVLGLAMIIVVAGKDMLTAILIVAQLPLLPLNLLYWSLTGNNPYLWYGSSIKKLSPNLDDACTHLFCAFFGGVLSFMFIVMAGAIYDYMMRY